MDYSEFDNFKVKRAGNCPATQIPRDNTPVDVKLTVEEVKLALEWLRYCLNDGDSGDDETSALACKLIGALPSPAREEYEEDLLEDC